MRLLPGGADFRSARAPSGQAPRSSSPLVGSRSMAWAPSKNVGAGPRRRERKSKPSRTLPPLVPMDRRQRLPHMVFMLVAGPQAHGDRSEICPTRHVRMW
jgi:hypothetical protein